MIAATIVSAVAAVTCQVEAKIALVDALREMEVATSLLRSPALDSAVDALDGHYAKLKCGLTLLPQVSAR